MDIDNVLSFKRLPIFVDLWHFVKKTEKLKPFLVGDGCD
jgi:hypothetical protein